MRIEQGNITYRDLGYDRHLSKSLIVRTTDPIARGDLAGGDLGGLYPRPSVLWDNGTSTYNLQYLALSGGTLTGTLNTDLVVLKVFSQAGEPDTDDISSGACAMWIDTDDSNRLYFCYNQSGTVKTVELT